MDNPNFLRDNNRSIDGRRLFPELGLSPAQIAKASLPYISNPWASRFSPQKLCDGCIHVHEFQLTPNCSDAESGRDSSWSQMGLG